VLDLCPGSWIQGGHHSGLPILLLEGAVRVPTFRPDNSGNKRWGSGQGVSCSLPSLSGGCVP